MMQTSQGRSDDPKPKRSKEEERKLIDDMKQGVFRCYFCDRRFDPDTEDASTEYGVFWACGACWPKWGNPDQDILDEDQDYLSSDRGPRCE